MRPCWSSGEKVWLRVMKDKVFDLFLRRSSGSRKVAGHVVRTGRPGSPVDVLWNALHHRKFVFFYTFCLSHKWFAGICDTLFLRDSCPWNNHIRQCCREVMGTLPHPTPARSETSVRLQCSQVYAFTSLCVRKRDVSASCYRPGGQVTTLGKTPTTWQI